MQRVLSFPSRTMSDESSELVTKRMCFSFMFSIGFICLLAGFLLGRFAFNQELEISRNKLKSAQKQMFNNTINGSGNDQSYVISQISSERVGQYIKQLNSLVNNTEYYQASLLVNHFKSVGLDYVSELVKSQILLSYPDPNKQNEVIIKNERHIQQWIGRDIRDTNGLHDGYSVPKLIQGHPVYVNFGRDEDYLYLDSLNIGVIGKIIIVRIGKLSVVEIVEKAIEHEARGILVFQDPQQSDVQSPLLTAEELAQLQTLHGDPSFHGNAEYSGTGSVPILIISSKDAKYIFSTMNPTSLSPDSWRGGLVSDYPIGPGFLNSDWTMSVFINTVNVQRTFYNVFAALSGADEDDKIIVVTSDRDSWAESDSVVNTAILMELATVFGQLCTERGWRPYRSLAFVSWGLKGFDTELSIHDENKWEFLQKSTATYIRFNVNISETDDSISVKSSVGLGEVLKNAMTLANSNVSMEYDTMLERTASDDIIEDGIPFLDFNIQNTRQDNSTLETLTSLLGAITWNLTISAQLPLSGDNYVEFLNHSIYIVNSHLGSIAKKHALFLDSLTNSANQFVQTWYSFQKNWTSNWQKTRIYNDRLLSLAKAFSCNEVDTQLDSKTRHILFSRGKSSLDPTSGFGVLQDLLRQITQEDSSDDIHQRIVTHLAVLVECLESVRRTLITPVQLLVQQKT